MSVRMALAERGWKVIETISPTSDGKAVLLQAEISKPGSERLTCSKMLFANEIAAAGFDIVQEERDTMISDLYATASGTPASEAA